MRARWMTTAGSSMIEVLVAMVITGIAATSATSGMVFTTNVLGENTMQHDAIVIAQQSLERMRTLAYEEIVSGTEQVTGGVYTLTKTVLDDTPEQDMKQITVNVTWKWKGKSRSYVLRTVFAQLTKS